jgi:hypothetical protein
MHSRRTWRPSEGARNVHHTAICRTLSPWRLCGSVTAEVHGCPRGVAPLRPSRAQGHPGGAPGRQQQPHHLPMPRDALPTRLASVCLLAMASPPRDTRRNRGCQENCVTFQQHGKAQGSLGAAVCRVDAVLTKQLPVRGHLALPATRQAARFNSNPSLQLKCSLSPGSGHSIMPKRPESDNVMYAVRMSAPPKHILVG